MRVHIDSDPKLPSILRSFKELNNMSLAAHIRGLYEHTSNFWFNGFQWMAGMNCEYICSSAVAVNSSSMLRQIISFYVGSILGVRFIIGKLKPLQVVESVAIGLYSFRPANDGDSSVLVLQDKLLYLSAVVSHWYDSNLKYSIRVAPRIPLGYSDILLMHP